MIQPSFRGLLLEAIREFALHGYTDEGHLQEWLMRLHTALDREMPADAWVRNLIGAALDRVFRRDVVNGGVTKRVPGVSRYTLDRIAPHLRAELDRRIFAGVDLIRLNRASAVQKTLQRFAGWTTSVGPAGSFVKPADLRAAAREIAKPVAQVKFEARRVAIDQGHKLSAAVAHVVAQDAGAIAAIWHDRGEFDHGYDARPEHLARTGKLFLVRGSWALEEGLIKRSGLTYTDMIEQPAELPFCFPGDTAIPYAEGVRVGYRRWYTGELTEIITASGKSFRATPNHPILTTHGWVAAGLLKESDYLIEVCEERINGVVSKPANHDAIPTLAQVFSALSKSGDAREIGGSCDQFHGDGSEGHVDIVDAARPLTFDFVTPIAKDVDQLSFAKTYLRGTRLGTIELFGQSGPLRTARLMRGLHATLAPFGSATLQVDARSLGYRSNRSTGLDDPNRYGRAADSEFGGEPLHGLTGFVATTKVVSVKRSDFAGHVFNLQTATGQYVANGIIVHNCSCRYEYITTPRDLPAEVITAKGRAWMAGPAAPVRRNDAAVPVSVRTVRVHGLEIAIETAKGETRMGIGEDGQPWRVTMPAAYGFIKGVPGADGDNLDCYIGPDRSAPSVWVIEQVDPRTGAFDEHKVMLGFSSEAEALATYRKGFSDGLGAERIGSVTGMHIERFKDRMTTAA